MVTRSSIGTSQMNASSQAKYSRDDRTRSKGAPTSRSWSWSHWARHGERILPASTGLGDSWIIIDAARNAQLKKTVRKLQHDLSDAQINVQLLLLASRQSFT